MSGLRKSSIFDAGTMLLAALAVIPMLQIARAQAETSQLGAQPAQTPAQNPPAPQGRYGTATRSSLDEPRAIAVAVVAADNPSPKYVVDVGAAKGDFLALFLDKFADAHGQWTESDLPDHTQFEAKPYLARFGDRVDYKLGCSLRDMTQPCFPRGTDVIITSFMSIHQDLDGMYKNYRAAFKVLPSSGWIVNVDSAGFGGSAWEPLLQKAVVGFRPVHEGPKIHHPDLRIPTVDEQLGAMRAAGFDAQVVWQSFTTVLFMGRKP